MMQIILLMLLGLMLPQEFEYKGNPLVRDKHTADPATLVENDTLWLFAGHDFEGRQKDYVMKDGDIVLFRFNV